MQQSSVATTAGPDVLKKICLSSLCGTGILDLGLESAAGISLMEKSLWEVLRFIDIDRDCWSMILNYLLSELKIGDLYDVKGGSAGLNMFCPAHERWDLCRLISIDNTTFSFIPVDRVHPYGYLYPNGWSPHRCEILLDQLISHVAPALSKVKRPKPSEAKEYDLLDYVDEDGQVRMVEVSANIGTSLWILNVDIYTSAEFKDSLRKWVSIDNPNLRLYRSAPFPHIPQKLKLSPSDLLIGYKYLHHSPHKSNDWIHLSSLFHIS